MLDENLPTFRFLPSPDNPADTLLHYTHSGSDPVPSYLIRRPSPSASPNRYAAAIADPSLPSIIYGETLVEPTWSSPSASDPRPEALTPSTTTLTLYNPDQSVDLRHSPSSWNRSESWDFDLPTRTFRIPSSSALDRSDAPPTHDASVPKVFFKWKKDGRMSRDMTCYMVGRSVDGKRSKEPDITVALFGQGRGGDCAVTVYEPNLSRVEVEDRKGLEVVLLLGAEAIRSLYLNKGDPFNLSGSAGKRRESRPAAIQPATAAAMTGAAAAPPPGPPPGPPPAQSAQSAQPDKKPQGAGAGAAPDRERRDREEQDRIRRMLEEEEAREKARRDAEVERETERLRQLYGVPGEGQPQQQAQAQTQSPAQSPAQSPSQGQWQGGLLPPLPPRPAQGSSASASGALPPRPVSAEPYAYGAQGHSSSYNQSQSQGQGQGQGQGGTKCRVEGFVNSLFRGDREREREEERRKKVHKKRSVHF